ncbi:MAG: hypothetical protein P4L43_16400 [Syntrophobacteraceae bacterium]|nr:hypothetical protein [Syntrophobacteraceae bacterium]
MDSVTDWMASRKILRSVVCLGLLAMLFTSLSPKIVDPDVWWEMAFARQTLALGHIPLHDHFAYTPTLFPVMNHEWGGSMIVYWLAGHFGRAGIVAATYLFGILISLVGIRCARLRGAGFESLAVMAPVFIALIIPGFSPIRSQLYSFLFFAVLLVFLEQDKTGRRGWLAAWPGVYVVWVNLHGGFVVAIVILAAHCFEQALRKRPYVHLVILIVAMFGLIGVNPYGFHYYSYLRRALFMSRPFSDEWHPLWSIGKWTQVIIPLLVLYSFALVLYIVKTLGVKNLSGIVIFLGVALEAVLHKRMLPFYAIAWISYVPGWIGLTPMGEVISQLFERRRAILLSVFLAATLFFTGRFISLRSYRLLAPGDLRADGLHAYPVGPVDYLKKIDFKGNLMTFFDDGAYVSWELYPNVLVSMDARYEVAYPDRTVEENVCFYTAGKGWKTVLARYPTDLVMIRKKMPIAKALSKTDWRKIYTDSTYELYERPGLSLPPLDCSNRSFEGKVP